MNFFLSWERSPRQKWENFPVSKIFGRVFSARQKIFCRVKSCHDIIFFFCRGSFYNDRKFSIVLKTRDRKFSRQENFPISGVVISPTTEKNSWGGRKRHLRNFSDVAAFTTPENWVFFFSSLLLVPFLFIGCFLCCLFCLFLFPASFFTSFVPFSTSSIFNFNCYYRISILKHPMNKLCINFKINAHLIHWIL